MRYSVSAGWLSEALRPRMFVECIYRPSMSRLCSLSCEYSSLPPLALSLSNSYPVLRLVYRSVHP